MKKGKNFNRSLNKPRVLIAPLDWGLGHATRCIPIVISLLKYKCEVIFAAEGATKELLQKEFPQLVFLPLKGYQMRYSHSNFWLPVTLLLQFPKLLSRVYSERRWLKNVVKEHKIDAVISDNRLGMSHAAIPSVYITHQLLIKTGSRFTEAIAQKIHYHFINKYQTCWLPDWVGEKNLAGELSHPTVLPKTPIKHIGPLSRFENVEAILKYDLCVLISGPEPQRSIFEKIIFAAVKNSKIKVVVVRGLPNETNTPAFANSLVEIKNHLPAAALNNVLLQSKHIVARSGYSTIMDLVKLQRHAMLIPTPGQTEQEYLATYLQQQRLFCTVDQHQFNLDKILNEVENFTFCKFPAAENEFDEVIKDFVNGLATNQ